jgi:hypothetical protein
MTDIAIRVDNLSKLYPEPAARAGHLGALQQRHDTNAPSLSASLPDALTGAFTRRRHNGPAPNDHRSPFLGTGEPGSPITDYRSLITDHRSPITDHRSPFTDHRSPFTDHRSPPRRALGAARRFLRGLTCPRYLASLALSSP